MVRIRSRTSYTHCPVRLFSAPNSARVTFVPGVGMRTCGPTQCHMARTSGRSWSRDSSAYRIAASGPASTTALTISYCVRAFAGSTLVGMANRGRPHRRPSSRTMPRRALALSRTPSLGITAKASMAMVQKVAR